MNPFCRKDKNKLTKRPRIAPLRVPNIDGLCAKQRDRIHLVQNIRESLAKKYFDAVSKRIRGKETRK